MAASIKLMRFGKKNYPTYRIVVVDKRKKLQGAYLEKIGTYNPMTDPETLALNQEKLQHWLKIGAEPSEGVRKLLKRKIKTTS